MQRKFHTWNTKYNQPKSGKNEWLGLFGIIMSLTLVALLILKLVFDV